MQDVACISVVCAERTMCWLHITSHSTLQPPSPPPPQTPKQHQTTQVAVEEMRRLQRFGLTAGELDRYIQATMRDR